MAERHYAPRARLELVDRGAGLTSSAGRVAYVGIGALPALPAGVRGVLLPLNAEAVAAQLYALLHELDGAGFELIVMERPPEGEAWLAVQDRLQRASAKELA